MIKPVATLLLCTFLSGTVLAQGLTAGSVEYEDMRFVGRNYVTIRISGQIAPPMAEKFKEFVEALPRKVPLVLQLNSGGGLVPEGEKMIEALESVKENRKISTLVRNGDRCGSMCLPLFLQGHRRLAGPASSFMFHGATLSIYTNIPDKEATEKFLQHFTKAGVSPDWIKKLSDQQVFSAPGEEWYAGQELLTENSNVATELISRSVRFAPIAGSVDPKLGSQ